MSADLSVRFTGLRFENPFLLSSAPPTESESNILRAFETGWGGVVTKTIGLHPVVNVKGPKTKFLRSDVENPTISMMSLQEASAASAIAYSVCCTDRLSCAANVSTSAVRIRWRTEKSDAPAW